MQQTQPPRTYRGRFYPQCMNEKPCLVETPRNEHPLNIPFEVTA